MNNVNEEIKDFYHLIPELSPIYRVDGLRKKEGMIEFGLKTIRNEIVWFPFYRLPVKAEEWIRRMMKLGEFND